MTAPGQVICITPSSARRCLITALAAAISALVLFPAPLCAAAPALQPEISPTIDGRDFADVDLPTSPQRADVEISCRRAFAWTERVTQRLLIEGEARVRIDGHDFGAKRAVIWIEPVELDGRPLHQIAVWLDTVSDPGADVNIAQTADRLLVTALVEGEVRLRADLLTRGRSENDLVREGEARFARFLRRVAGIPEPLEASDSQTREGTDAEYEPLRLAQEPISQLPAFDQSPLVQSRSTISFYGPDRTFITGDNENALVVTGGVVVQASQIASGRSLQMTARSMVVFLDPESVADVFQTGAEQVRGVYLEGDVVATDGAFTLRGPRMFYDVASNRAVVLDAVFSTYDVKTGLPLYLRADVIRQEADRQWTAGRSTLSNSSFFEPTFTIGAESVTISQAPSRDGELRTRVDATGVTARIRGVTALRLPRYHGGVKQAIAGRVSYGTDNGNGIIRTRWRVQSLLGSITPDWLDGELNISGYFNRGPAFGTDLNWKLPGKEGSLFSFFIHDKGLDKLTSGAEIDSGDTNRGIILGEQRWRVNDMWTLFFEASYLSDETVVDAFFNRFAETRREITNSLYARRVEGSKIFTMEARGSLNDFTSNEFLLQSPGFQVQRTPEFTYWRMNDSLFGGRLRHSSQTSVSALRLNLTDPTPRELGFDTKLRSQTAFGLNPNQRLAQRERAAGLGDRTVLRFDTRHELTTSFATGPIKFVPFLVARVTAYDDEFSGFRGAGGNNDRIRLFTSAGVRASTSLVHINKKLRSRLFDLNQMRHILEPSMTVWSSGSSIDSSQLPVFDDRVESLADGTAVRFALASTWQTKRGGPRHERTVDWLTLRAAFVESTSGTNVDSPIGRYFQSRPELSNFGDFATVEGTWRLTDAVALSTDNVYDTEAQRFASDAAGIIIDHGYGFSSFAELRQIDALNSTFVNFGAAYELTRKYALDGTIIVDLNTSELQQVRGTVTRRLPQWTLEFGASFDSVRNDTRLLIQLRPAGFGNEKRRRVFTHERGVDGLPLDRSPLYWRRRRR